MSSPGLIHLCLYVDFLFQGHTEGMQESTGSTKDLKVRLYLHLSPLGEIMESWVIQGQGHTEGMQESTGSTKDLKVRLYLSFWVRLWKAEVPCATGVHL